MTLSGDTESTFRHLECLSLRNIEVVCEQVRFLRIKKYLVVIRTGKTHLFLRIKAKGMSTLYAYLLAFIVFRCFTCIRAPTTPFF